MHTPMSAHMSCIPKCAYTQHMHAAPLPIVDTLSNQHIMMCADARMRHVWDGMHALWMCMCLSRCAMLCWIAWIAWMTHNSEHVIHISTMHMCVMDVIKSSDAVLDAMLHQSSTHCECGQYTAYCNAPPVWTVCDCAHINQSSMHMACCTAACVSVARVHAHALKHSLHTVTVHPTHGMHAGVHSVYCTCVSALWKHFHCMFDGKQGKLVLHHTRCSFVCAVCFMIWYILCDLQCGASPSASLPHEYQFPPKGGIHPLFDLNHVYIVCVCMCLYTSHPTGHSSLICCIYVCMERLSLCINMETHSQHPHTPEGQQSRILSIEMCCTIAECIHSINLEM